MMVEYGVADRKYHSLGPYNPYGLSSEQDSTSCVRIHWIMLQITSWCLCTIYSVGLILIEE
jgi:hypothetical protein